MSGDPKNKKKARVCGMTPYSGPAWGFDLTASCPMSWRMKAEELRRAADVLWHVFLMDMKDVQEFSEIARSDPDPRRQLPYRPSVVDPFMLLAGLGIENALKGFLVARRPECVSRGKLRGKIITSHDLVRLAREAGVTLSDDEEQVCRLATSAVEGWGRYPIPRNMSKMKGEISVGGQAYAVYSALVDRLLGDLEREIHRWAEKPRKSGPSEESSLDTSGLGPG